MSQLGSVAWGNLKQPSSMMVLDAPPTPESSAIEEVTHSTRSRLQAGQAPDWPSFASLTTPPIALSIDTFRIRTCSFSGSCRSVGASRLSLPSPRHDLADDGALRVGVVLSVFPDLFRQSPFGPGIQLAVFLTGPQPVAKSKHSLYSGHPEEKTCRFTLFPGPLNIRCSCQPASRICSR